ncbi:hypothetical protein [Liquorilactobacillus hordei]|uniref:Uncharacterized protein n=1 Tax=Liquorilactobacillus hordei DSM 19519 TaxID=1423759 RepID=A0A0R1MQA3_9LACO|nr:hypothetical protein [Liquorilactobacillus hordei]KRL07924.1 hypothetical protein FC92_GL000991 [Liquorilactobacillus hordei DSM 19519]QYH51129.1 hypothetical protein G6O70_00800 [Liquorilactobacillus hordei DSM 19519]
MSDTFASDFRKHMKIVGSSRYERNMRNKTREFENYFNNALNKENCFIDGRATQAIFQDQSQSNNKDLSDDKYLILPNVITCEVGSYINWRLEEWLVFTEEFKTIPTHQQLKIKHVNQKLKWVTDYDKHSISNNGAGWGAYVQNQTLYTLGVSFTGNHLSLINAKMMLYVKNTDETKKIAIGDRFFISGNVYKVEFADSISRVGLINLLLDEDTLNPEIDNEELGIADYWKPTQQESEKEKDIPKDILTWEVSGEEKIKLGRSYSYKAIKKNADGTQEQLKVKEWNIETLQDMPITILERDEDTLQIRVIDDSRNIGTIINLIVKVDDQMKNLTLKVAAKFS